MKNLFIHTIVTHSGTFHADEIFAIALMIIALGKKPEIIRTRQIKSEWLSDPTIAVIDVGGNYDPGLSNFDHHQDDNLPASNMLVLQALNPWFKTRLELALFSRISDIDRGRLVPNEDTYGINRLVRTMNHLQDGFDRALQMAINILEGFVAEADVFNSFDNRWETFERESDGKIVIVRERYPIGWEASAREDPVRLIVSGDGNLWQITARRYGGRGLNIPQNPNQLYRHPSGFMATYSSFESALEHAKQIVKPCP